MPSNSKVQVSRIRGYDPLDMVSLILKERHSKTKVRILQTKTRPNHFLMLLTKYLKILEKIAFAFITSHRTNSSFQIDQLVRQIPSTNQSLSDIHSGKHIPPDILKTPTSDIHSGSSNPGNSESTKQINILEA